MHRDVLTVLASINPECVIDQAVRAALIGWHEEIAHMVRAARRGDIWTAPRSPQEREEFLSRLLATILLDVSTTAARHAQVGGDTPEHATASHETEEPKGEAAAPEAAPDSAADVDPSNPEPLRPVRALHTEPGQ